MKFAPVAPPSYLNRMPQTGYHLVLSNVALKYHQAREYYAFRARMGDFVILDNPVHERLQSPSLEQCLALAALIRPSAMTVLDTIGDPEKTLEQFHHFAPFIRKIPGVEPMGVVQGQNWNDYVQCAYSLGPNVRYLGIPLVRKYEPVDRAEFVDSLTNMGFFGQFPQVYIHLLGADQEMSDAFRLRNHPRVMGIDSAKPVYLGAKCASYEDAERKSYLWGRPEGYFDLLEPTEEQIRHARRNVEHTLNRLSRWEEEPSLACNARNVAV